MKKKLLAVVIIVLVICGGVLYTRIPHSLFERREGEFTPELAHVYVGDNFDNDEVTDPETLAAIWARLQQVTYRKRIFPTGQSALQIEPDMIQLKIRYVPNVNNENNWDSWTIYLTPRSQTCTHGSYQWMYPICDGEELYEDIGNMIVDEGS